MKPFNTPKEITMHKLPNENNPLNFCGIKTIIGKKKKEMNISKTPTKNITMKTFQLVAVYLASLNYSLTLFNFNLFETDPKKFLALDLALF